MVGTSTYSTTATRYSAIVANVVWEPTSYCCLFGGPTGRSSQRQPAEGDSTWNPQRRLTPLRLFASFASAGSLSLSREPRERASTCRLSAACQPLARPPSHIPLWCSQRDTPRDTTMPVLEMWAMHWWGRLTSKRCDELYIIPMECKSSDEDKQHAEVL